MTKMVKMGQKTGLTMGVMIMKMLVVTKEVNICVQRLKYDYVDVDVGSSVDVDVDGYVGGDGDGV